MANTSEVAAVNPLLKKTPWQKFWIRFKKNWQLHLMVFVPLCYLILFSYVPMYGLQIAFKDYRAKAGIWGSEWVGLENFAEFFKGYKWPMYVWNTLALSLYSLFASFPIPIVLALTIHVNTHKTLKKVAQNVSYMPHFISLVVMIGILFSTLHPVAGMLGAIYRFFKVENPIDIRYAKQTFRHLYVWSGVWQGMGWSSILYVSALSGVPDELHEAAKLDGASRLRRVWAIDIPTILPTICIMLIMRCGSLLSVGYQKAYLMQSPVNKDVSEIISTYVYNNGLKKNEMSFGTAVGLMNSVINVIMLTIVNWITNKLSDHEMGLW